MIVALESLSRELMNWYDNSAIKAINIVSVPYRGVEPIEDLLDRLGGKKRILYITGTLNEGDDLIRFLKEKEIQPVFQEDKKAKMVILDYDQALKIRHNYDLIIYDDLNTFPTHRKSEMQGLLNYAYYRAERIIAYSLEKVFRNVISLELPLKKTGSFVTEPRFIDTKLNIRSGIPNSIYEYIEFFYTDRRDTMIFVPDRSTGEAMANYLKRINPELGDTLYSISGLGHDEVKKLLEGGNPPRILFTDAMDDFSDVPVNFDFIVSMSDHIRYDYRQFVFLCLRAGLYEEVNGEVILISQTMTDDMARTKELTQSYNRVLWENDQLFV